MTKRFNITGTCFPDRHYMVDISDRVAQIKKMVDDNDYFCINRGRQYGKTTTLNQAARSLSKEYSVFFISFEGMAESQFESVESLAYTFLRRLRSGMTSETTETVSSPMYSQLQSMIENR